MADVAELVLIEFLYVCIDSSEPDPWTKFQTQIRFTAHL